MNLLPSTLVLALVLAGCAPFKQPPLSHSSPASPNAAETSSPAPVSFLMSGNNYAMAPEGEGQPMQMDMKMDMPGHQSHEKRSGKTPEHDHPGHEQKQTTPPHEHQHETPKP